MEEELRSEMEEAWQKFEDDGGCTNFTANPDENIDEEIEEITPPKKKKPRVSIVENPQTKASSSTPSPEETAEPATPTPTPKKGRKNPESLTEEEKEKASEEKKKIAKLTRRIVTMKKDMSAALTATHDTINLIQKDPAWKWAGYPEILGPLHAARNEIEQLKCSNDFMKCWTVSDDPVKALRGKFTLEVINREMEGNFKKLEESVKKLQQRVSTLKKGHHELSNM